VDPAKENLYFLKTALSGNGFEFNSAIDGTEALNIARNNPPDLVITEILLDGMDGFKLCFEWKKDKILKSIPLLFYTGQPKNGREQKFAIKLGADDFLIKPSDRDKLNEIVNKLINDTLTRRLVTPKSNIITEDQFLKEYNQIMANSALLSVHSSYYSNSVNGCETVKNEIQDIQSMFENLTIGLYRTTANGKILCANAAAVKILGFISLEELQERNLEIEGFAPDTPRTTFKRLMEEKGEVIGIESGWKHKDGSDIYVRENAKAIKDNIGNIIYYEGTVEDITEHKRIEQALIKSEEKYREIVTLAPIGIYQSSLEGKFITVNECLVKILGYDSVEELISSVSLKDIYYNRSERKKLITAHDRPEAGLSTKVELRWKRKDGSPVWILLTAHAIHDANLISKYYEGFVIDITERKQAETLRKESEERYKSLYENATVGIYRTTPGGKLLMANPALMAMYGFSSFEELSKVNAEDIYFDPEDRNRFKDILEREGTVYGFESVGKKADGSKFYFLDSAKLIKDEEGNAIFYEGVVQDITEQRLALESLTESEKKFRQLIEQAPDGIFRLDPKGNFVLANTKTCELLGYTKEEILKLNIIETYTSPEEQKIARARLEQLKTGVDLYFERLMKRKDGKFVPVAATVKGLGDGSQAIIHDISSRKRNEFLQNAVYQISEATNKAKTLNELYKSVHEIIGSVIPAKNFFISLYDREKDMLTFPYFVDEIDSPPGPKKAGRGYTAYVLRTSKSVFYDEELDKRLKENGDVELVGTDSPAWLGVPLIIGYETIGVMVVQHYTDPNAYTRSDLHLLEYVSSQIAKAIVSKRAEEELRKLSSAVKQSSASIIITDILGNIEYVNPKFTEFTGYTLDEVKGKSPSIMKSGETPPEVYSELWTTISNGKEWRGEFLNKKKNGELFWESASISPIRDADGKITHFLAVKEDITENKRIQKELIESKEKAEELSRLKSTFLANMSHELRTPLVGILGYAEIIQSEIANDGQKEMIDTIIASGKRLMNTLNSILDLSKIEAEQNKIDSSPVKIVPLVNECVESYKPEADSKHIELKERIINENTASALDVRLFVQIINNLVSNAVKYTKKGMIEVVVDTDVIQQKSIIKVVDTGIGISNDDQKVIFEEFRQASEGLNRKFEGTGLGLTITKKFVELMNGEIILESEPGKGSVFTVTFPSTITQKVQDKNINDKLRIASSGEQIGNQETSGVPDVLLVEDDGITREAVKRILKNTCSLDTAANGAESISMAANNKYDLILMDINLGPGINGLEAASAIRKISGYEDIPIVALTAYALAGDEEKFLKEGCTHYLSKPFSAKDIIGLIKKILKEK
jgi:PAS domain S-box-containing protein